MHRIVDSRWFALADVLLVLTCAAIRIIEPTREVGIALLALVPLGMRLAAGHFPFRRTSLDWLIAIFLLTAWVGYWAAYDETTAWNKVWMIVLAVLLYYAVVSQPKENWPWLSVLVFSLGIGISLYYFLTHDFATAPRKLEVVNRLGLWLMEIRPQVAWTPIHPNYVAGLAAITAPFVFYPLHVWRRQTPIVLYAAAGLAIIVSALFMTTSRGVIMAVVSGAGLWLVWGIAHLSGIRNRVRTEAFFPSLVLLYLCGIVAFLYAGPAGSGNIAPNYHFGDGSRGELVSRSLYLMWDYPITGGGLGSFPGLYSQYLLNLPFFNVPNSHNLFLDVAIEQGLLGGLSFVLMYLASIWVVASTLTQKHSRETSFLNAIVLFALLVAFVHGMVDNYLYNGNGSILALLLVALSVSVTRENEKPFALQFDRRIVIGILVVIGVLSIFSAKKLLGIWYANLGAVRMSQVELNGFPDRGWVGSEIVADLTHAEAALQSALQYDPANRTANQRLGMISLLRQDFSSASFYLEAAYAQAPQHRGIIKSLGYSYLWQGEGEKAKSLLILIPEARHELDAYVWWWETQGRSDLSSNATLGIQLLTSSGDQP